MTTRAPLTNIFASETLSIWGRKSNEYTTILEESAVNNGKLNFYKKVVYIFFQNINSEKVVFRADAIIHEEEMSYRIAGIQCVPEKRKPINQVNFSQNYIMIYP